MKPARSSLISPEEIFTPSEQISTDSSEQQTEEPTT